MKLAKKINPKNLFKSKKHNSNSVSRSQPSSFNSSASSESTGFTTPTSVLQNNVSPSYDIQLELLQAFQIIDVDKDGKISRSELESLLLKIAPSDPSEVNLMINEIDSNGDGNISLTELGVISSVFVQPLSDGELKGAFEFFDTDGDGMITAEELFHVFQAIGDGQCTLEDCKRMITSVDKNGDGFVCFEDFALMMEMQR